MFQTEESLSALNDPRCLESFVGAVFGERAHAFGGESNGYSAVEFRHKDALFLKVCLFAHGARRVKFGGANTVAVAASNKRALFGDWADFRHNFEVV